MFPGTYVGDTPDKPALIVAETGETVTFAELDERSLRVARYLYDAGLRPGDHVALMSDNTVPAYEIIWAALRSGLYITPVSRHLAAPEAAFIIDDCDAKALFASAAFAANATYALDHTPQVGLYMGFGGELPGFTDYATALARETTPAPLPEQPLGSGMLYSGGTTGRPRGIVRPLPGVSVEDPAMAGLLPPAIGDLFGLDRETVYLSPAPLYHSAPFAFSVLVQALGGTAVVMSRFDAEAALRAIERYGVTASQWVPTMFVRMLRLAPEVRNRFDLSTHRFALHGAAPCPIGVKRDMIEWWGPILVEYLGMTESVGYAVITTEEWLRKPGSIGRPIGNPARICDESGAEVPVGEIGTVYFESPDGLTFSYHKDPANTRNVVHPDHPRWATVGDVGYLDSDGYLYLSDRNAFKIIAGGINVYPQEIENRLLENPKVADVGVIGVGDEEMGELVCAVVELSAGVTGTPALEAELQAFVGETLARYKVPNVFRFVTDLPRTDTGKLLKAKLRERYAGPTGELPSDRSAAP